MLAKIDGKACIGCGICEGACPNDAISCEMTASVDEEKCIGCSDCADECPMSAISMIEREK